MEEKSEKKKKSKKHAGAITAAVLAAALLGSAVYAGAASGKSPEYLMDTAKRRDIENARTFTGTVAPGSETVLNTALSDVTVEKVFVKKGDTVQKGDVIAKLSTDSVEQKIREQEAALNKEAAVAKSSVDSAQLSLRHAQDNKADGTDASVNQARQSLRTAQETYDNLQNNISKNLDPDLQNAQNGMKTAFQELLDAQNAYNNEVGLNNEQLSQTILSAQQSVATAGGEVTSAQLALSQAQDARTHAEETWDPEENGGKAYDPFEQDQAVAAAQVSLENAWTAYRNAKDSYEAAKINEENALTNLYDAVLKAQDGYLAAVDTYNAKINSLNQELVRDLEAVEDAKENLASAEKAQDQQIETYSQQVFSARASADITQEQLSLDHLKDSLGEYTIQAPASGVITDLRIFEGSTIGTGSVCTIADFGTMKVDVKIGEYDIDGAKEGSPVTVTMNALSDSSCKGSITSISRTATVENGVSYFASEVEFRPDENVRSGMSCEVRLVTDRADGAVSVPSAAVQTAEDGTTYCLVTTDGGKTVEHRTVTAGISDGTYTEIREGLSEKETVCWEEPVQTEDASKEEYEEGAD